MNIRLYSLLVLTLSLSVNAEDNQASADTLRFLCQTVKPTAAGFTSYLKDVYNNPYYAQEVLPNHMNHLIQFLEHGKTTNQSRDYMESVVRLFSHKIKGCPYLITQSLDRVLQALPRLLEGHCVEQYRSFNPLQEKIETIFYERFKADFSLFKNNPTTFFHDLSQEVVQALTVHTAAQDEVTVGALQKTVLIFLEVALNKLIWSPEDKIESWNSVVSIGESLAKLADCMIVADTEDLNGLFITLIERYCFFLDVTSEHLDAVFYQQLCDAITSGNGTLLTLEEQEACMETKRDRLLRAIAGKGQAV
jgi:hypothetical protein